MPKYSNPMDPHHAARRFNGQPGNYVLHFADGTAYAGRQSEGGRRIETHRRRNADLTAVQFMTDHSGSSCKRATRERQTVEQLRQLGLPVRNRIQPSMPTTCVSLVPVRRTVPTRVRRDESSGAAVLIGAGAVMFAGWLINEVLKTKNGQAV